MEEGSKRRLVGTAVVVLLLVIFLPMLLEEEQTNPIPDSDLEIPVRPDFEADFEPGLDEPSADTFALPTTPELPVPDRYQTPMPEPAPQVQPAQAARPISESVPVASTRDPGPVSDPEPPPLPQPAPAAHKPAGNIASWVIQVSSLTEQPRALSLERELRAKGFPAFIEKAQIGGKTYHRVRVGPEVARKDIESMAASLRDKAGFSGQILRYP